MFNLIRPFIFKFSPEVAHSLAIKALKLNQIPAIDKTTRVTIQTKFLNKTLNSPLGVAAGFDKNAEVYNPLYKLGFGFVEVGTITPKPQIGNPKPRVFRLEEDEALINRLGFNNIGSEESKKNIENKHKKFFLTILNTLTSIQERTDKVFVEYGLNLLMYEDLYFTVIEDLIYEHYGDQVGEIIFWWVNGKKVEGEDINYIEDQKTGKKYKVKTPLQVYNICKKLKLFNN